MHKKPQHMHTDRKCARKKTAKILNINTGLSLRNIDKRDTDRNLIFLCKINLLSPRARKTSMLNEFQKKNNRNLLGWSLRHY